jgi:uncharacterized protein (DUF885 family)
MPLKRDAEGRLFKASRITRRKALEGFAAIATSPGFAVFAEPAEPAERGRLNDLLDLIASEKLRRLPEHVTALGLDGMDRWRMFKTALNDRSVIASVRDRRDIRRWQTQLKAIDRGVLSGQDAINYEVVSFWLATEDDVNQQFGEVTGRPYSLTHTEGAYISVPELLVSKHEIADRADVEAYLQRLEAFAIAIEQDSKRVHHDSEHGMLPPDFVIDTTIEQLSELALTPGTTSFPVASLARREIAQPYVHSAMMIWDDAIVPALNRQVALLSNLRLGARHDAGLWSVENGEARYAALLRLTTSTDKSAEELHTLGLETSRDIEDRLDTALHDRGLIHGTVGERLYSIFNDPAFRYSNTDEGKAIFMADLEALRVRTQEWLPIMFRSLPKAEAIIRPASRAGPDAYYEEASLDGSRPGACYFTLDPAIWPKWRVASTLRHELIPGHHLQSALTLENSEVPLLTKTLWFAGYCEGWALYSEQLAEEGGLYIGDQMSRIGYLFASLLRASRLVVDTGLHCKRWSREQASQYLQARLGVPGAVAEQESDRCCVTPGLSCSYMAGKVALLALRARAQNALGSGFDPGAFHDAVLLRGPMPLTVLERVIGDFILANKA